MVVVAFVLAEAVAAIVVAFGRGLAAGVRLLMVSVEVSAFSEAGLAEDGARRVAGGTALTAVFCRETRSTRLRSSASASASVTCCGRRVRAGLEDALEATASDTARAAGMVMV